MLLRLINTLFARKRRTQLPDASSQATEELAVRGSALGADGTARAVVRVQVGAAADPRNLAVEGHQELRSAALLQSHYLERTSPEALFELHVRYGRMLEAEAAPFVLPPRAIDADPDRRLRIGYVSPNFADHSVSYFFEPVLSRHDRSAFEVRCYHTGPYRDDTTARIAGAADAWLDSHELSDDALAWRVAADGVDILVDLAGHTQFGRLGVFARRPAPVQMTWLGYPDTTGLASIDYRVTDGIADPPCADVRHTERLVRLPPPFLVYQPPVDAPAVAARDEAADVVFCSFNTLQKVNDAVIALWSRVIKAVPGSRMLIKGGRLLDEPEAAQRLRNAFAAQGIDAARVELYGWIENRAEHLALYGRADVALDTFPYHGTTTTCEAMWMGVPVVTLAGEAHMSRVGASLLTAVGLGELVAGTADEFVDIAVSLARDATRRRAQRAALRPRMAASKLLDHAGFTRNLEAAMRTAWTAWCATAAR
jgi:predicted O-linked N-acetylglucosamine transferase (SPINDLY family)